jgi:glycosyltransferase involved in cell wall biosynthesis
MGLPIVSTKVGGIPEMIQSGETGILVPPGDATALARALKSLTEDSNMRWGLAVAANKSGIERYHSVSNARAISAVYRRVARDSSPI